MSLCTRGYRSLIASQPVSVRRTGCKFRIRCFKFPNNQHLLSCFRSARPAFRHERGRLGPWWLDEGILKPLVTKVGVFCHDELETRDILLREFEQQLEQSANRRQIGVCLRFWTDPSASW